MGGKTAGFWLFCEFYGSALVRQMAYASELDLIPCGDDKSIDTPKTT
jgi:hypothetical protein